MGFEREESLEALEICGGRVEEAVMMLTSSSHRVEGPSQKRRRESNESRQSSSLGAGPGSLKIPNETTGVENGGSLGVICGIDIRVLNLSLCVIDDCKDADVPLLELNINQLELSQNRLERSAEAECVLSGDYYNRELCGWEPLLEPWKCHVSWKQNERGQLGKLSPSSEFPTKAPELEISVTSRQVMNINITSTLLNLYSTVSSNWSEAYNHQDKRRAPFVPYILRNETGSALWFSTILSNHEEVLRQQKRGPSHPDGTSWIQVSNGGTQTFSFEGRGKLRHRNTHQLRTHQLAVRVQGWQDSNPVSVDRVGTYFRAVKPVSSASKHYGLVSGI
jgi:vacuolar protein sorting-associated protein 13D